jgi:hypothetical protein
MFPFQLSLASRDEAHCTTKAPQVPVVSTILNISIYIITY